MRGGSAVEISMALDKCLHWKFALDVDEMVGTDGIEVSFHDVKIL